MSGRGVISASAADKLTKICALFSSDHAGERASAALKAHRIVSGAGLSWSDLLADVGQGKAKAEQHRQHFGPRDLLTRFPAKLTIWERDFLESLANRPRNLTQKQQKIYAEIRRRVTGGVE